MDAAAAVRSPVCISRLPRYGVAARASDVFDPRSGLSAKTAKGFGSSVALLRQGSRQTIYPKNKRAGIVKACSASPSEESSASIAPLRLESPVGQFLSQILASHPHLLPAAVEQQLEQLQTDRESSKGQEEPSPTGGEIVLYRRIAEVRAKERKRALEEILYTLVVQKFVEAGVSLVPALAQSTGSTEVERLPAEEEKLERLHSSEAYEMIETHLSLILGQRMGADAGTVTASKLRVGQVYAASVMYGYFLKRVDQRFQLEKSIKSLRGRSEEEDDAIKQAMTNDTRPSTQPASTHPEMLESSWTSPSFPMDAPSQTIKPSRLRSYVMSFDSDTLQRYATIRSKEALGIIEKHTEALFGRPEIVITPMGTVDSSKDEVIQVSFPGLKRLFLEAVTFGSFLWDVESYVDSRYHFVTS